MFCVAKSTRTSRRRWLAILRACHRCASRAHPSMAKATTSRYRAAPRMSPWTACSRAPRCAHTSMANVTIPAVASPVRTSRHVRAVRIMTPSTGFACRGRVRSAPLTLSLTHCKSLLRAAERARLLGRSLRWCIHNVPRRRAHRRLRRRLRRRFRLRDYRRCLRRRRLCLPSLPCLHRRRRRRTSPPGVRRALRAPVHGSFLAPACPASLLRGPPHSYVPASLRRVLVPEHA